MTVVKDKDHHILELTGHRGFSRLRLFQLLSPLLKLLKTNQANSTLLQSVLHRIMLSDETTAGRPGLLSLLNEGLLLAFELLAHLCSLLHKRVLATTLRLVRGHARRIPEVSKMRCGVVVVGEQVALAAEFELSRVCCLSVLPRPSPSHPARSRCIFSG